MYHYFIVRNSDGLCFQSIQSSKPNKAFNFKDMTVVMFEGYYDVLGTYFLDGKWFRKVWNETDENGNPVEESGFEMVEFTPEMIGG